MPKPNFFKTLKFKLILIFSIVVILILSIFGSSLWWKNSVYPTYYRVSTALLERDFESFFNQLDLDKVVSNLPNQNEVDQGFIPKDKEGLKQYIIGSFLTVDGKKLPKNRWEVFGNSNFKQDGNKYVLDLYQFQANLSPINKTTLTFESQNNTWKIIKIDIFFGSENYTAKEYFEKMKQEYQNQPEYQAQKNVRVGESAIIYDFQVKIIGSQLLDSLEAYPTDQVGVKTSDNKIKITPRSNQTKLLKIEYSQQNQTSSNVGATDLSREFKLQTQNGESLDPIKNISDTVGGQKLEGADKYTEVAQNSTITRIVVFEVNNNFEIANSVLLLPNSQKGGQDTLFNLK